MSLLVLCPTKGRCAAATETWRTWTDTRTRPDTELLFVVNDDDRDYDHSELPLLRVPRREWMNEVLQEAVDHVLAQPSAPSALGFIGDDNRFRTRGWDERVVSAIEHGGIAYGNDLAQGANLPAHVFISTRIVKALGYFGLRGLRHLYLDNTWKTLGDEAGCLAYLDDVIVEHLHPSFGKGAMDDSYRATNSGEMFHHDALVYWTWVGEGRERDVQIVRDVLA